VDDRFGGLDPIIHGEHLHMGPLARARRVLGLWMRTTPGGNDDVVTFAWRNSTPSPDPLRNGALKRVAAV